MSTLTTKNSINNTKNFIEDVIGNDNAYYFFIGKPSPWPDDVNPPTATNSIEDTEQTIYHDMIAGKLIGNNNVAYLAPNVPWVNNAVYTPYDQSNDMYVQSNNYVVTSDSSVFKCIDNNRGAHSIVQPAIKATAGTFKTSDGYVWKYMFTIPSLSANFTTQDFIPIVANTFVANNVVPGTVDLIRVLNGGSNWQAYAKGYINHVINQQSLVLDANSVGVDDFYTGSSLYLGGGLAADQIVKIIAYNGATKVASVSPNLQTFVNLQLDGASVSGSILIGQLVTQSIGYINIINRVGGFNTDNFVIQSETGATGYVSHANSTFLQLHSVNGAISSNPAYPLFNTIDSLFPQTGTVSTTATSNVLHGVTANLLTLTVGAYYQVGPDANSNIRRLASITNSTYATVGIPFSNTFVANSFNRANNACAPAAVAEVVSSGHITDVNLNAIEIVYGNKSSSALDYILGETVKEYDSGGIDQSANAIVSFVNTSTVILSNINGSLTIGNYLTGQSSTLKSQIMSIQNYPNITLANTLGSFVAGELISATYGNSVVSGTANCLAFSYTPSYATQYTISPTVTILGDGSNAAAYSTVNTAPGSSYEITGITMVDTGRNYTYATAAISSNVLYGVNAILDPVVSPVKGHGYDPITELGARFAGISLSFQKPVNENYYFPTTAQYRKIGIIKNPLFKKLEVTHNAPMRLKFNVQNISGTFANGEIIYQPHSSAAGLIYFTNSTVMEIGKINGTFSSNASATGVNNMILGLTSAATANVVSTNALNFVISTNNQVVYQTNSGATGILSNVINSTMIALSDVNGKFSDARDVYDLTNNTYANSLSFYVANGATLTTSFGQRFTQASRITLSSNNNVAYQVGETVVQDDSNARGTVLNTTSDLDLLIQNLLGAISVGVTLTDANTGATAITLFANTTYIKLTGVNGSFNVNDKITSLTGNANILAAFPVITVFNVLDDIYFQNNKNITGQNSGAIGYTSVANTISHPDLTYNSGDVIYFNNILPFNANLTTQQTFETVIEF